MSYFVFCKEPWSNSCRTLIHFISFILLLQRALNGQLAYIHWSVGLLCKGLWHFCLNV
jgi:hypothetical protein